MHIQISRFFALATTLPSTSSGVLGNPVSKRSAGKRSIEVRDGVSHTIFEHESTGASIDFVTNSGVCETTPGVNQYSGYFSVGQNMSMWFWFFEARHHPHSAPLALWLNGGPGCSSMIGLFQENGPCTFNGNPNATEPSLNPHSWNEYANMLYVDEPIGTGFSYGTDTVNSTVSAAPFVWNLLQAFFAQFPEYECRDFGLFTESYGGHYGPEFADYIQEQNDAIDDGDLDAEEINLVALGINNGWYDATIQEREYISFSVNNSHYPLINSTIANAYMANYTKFCLPALNNCTSTTDDLADCQAAHLACSTVDNSFAAYYPTNYDSYDITQSDTANFPPDTYGNYLRRPDIVKKIGARANYSSCSDAVGNPFGNFADDMRSFLPTLSRVVQSGITVLIWAGDADSVCDWFGGYASVNAIDYSSSDAFRDTPVENFTVGGVVKVV
ncbi:alpha/beta-hydrolase [Acephala macrosclerotiorum]|nr:alpha/beta-hydrolase [Acephala macrosclerotiorum]